MTRPRLTVVELVIVVIIAAGAFALKYFLSYTYTWRSLLVFGGMAVIGVIGRAFLAPPKRGPGEHPHSMPRSKHFDR